MPRSYRPLGRLRGLRPLDQHGSGYSLRTHDYQHALAIVYAQNTSLRVKKKLSPHPQLTIVFIFISMVCPGLTALKGASVVSDLLIYIVPAIVHSLTTINTNRQLLRNKTYPSVVKKL